MSRLGLLFRLLIVLIAVVAATWISQEIRYALNMEITADNKEMVYRMIVVAIVAFMILLAIPFVPGAEVGLSLLALFGASIAPLVYCATVIGLSIAFCVGRFLPVETVSGGLRTIGMRKAADFIERSASLPPEDRIDRLVDGRSPRLVRLATRHRYLALMVAINVPGNVLIGGGGGIAMMAGMSKLFSPLKFLAAVCIAVCPVPLAILLFGV